MYRVRFKSGEVQVGIFDELSGDFDFDSIDEVEFIQALEVGQVFTTWDHFARWTRIS